MNMLKDEFPTDSGEAAYPAEQSTFPARASLAMSYVPYQRFENLYDQSKALSRGTLFACLDLPFYGRKEHRQNG